MESYDPPLSVYCSKGRVTSLRFKTSQSKVREELLAALSVLGVTGVLQSEVAHEVSGAHYASGFRFERNDTTIGPGVLDADQPDNPDASCVIVYISQFNAQLEGYLSKTLGELGDHAQATGTFEESRAEAA